MNIDNLVLIHIGKCGGSTLLAELELKNIKFEYKHIEKVKFNPNKKYLIVIRNPIKRFISAFYWRYYLVCDNKSQENRFKNEKQILNKYKNINNLCKNLKLNKNIFNGNPNSTNYIHHLKEDINFYLKDFIKVCPKNKIVGVICTETIRNDFKKLFDINLTNHVKHNKIKYNKDLKPKNYDILKNYLRKDYFIVKKMFKNGLLNKNQYSLLKK